MKRAFLVLVAIATLLLHFAITALGKDNEVIAEVRRVLRNQLPEPKRANIKEPAAVQVPPFHLLFDVAEDRKKCDVYMWNNVPLVMIGVRPEKALDVAVVDRKSQTVSVHDDDGDGVIDRYTVTRGESAGKRALTPI